MQLHTTRAYIQTHMHTHIHTHTNTHTHTYTHTHTHTHNTHTQHTHTHTHTQSSHHICLMSSLYIYRVYYTEVAQNNKNTDGKSFRIVPVSIELRPKGALNVLGFLLPEEEVSTYIHCR